MMWGLLALFMTSCTFIFSSVFFSWPKPLSEILSQNSYKTNLPDLIADAVKGHPTDDCYSEIIGSSVQLFENGCLISKFDENKLIAVITKYDGTLEWYCTKENFQKGVLTQCLDIENDSLLRLGFRWWYCSDIFTDIRPKLGRPISNEIKAWVQYQTWSEGLLFYGIPNTTFGYSNSHFQRLLGGFLKNYDNVKEGDGKFFTMSAANVKDAYCSAIWYPARPDGKMTEVQKSMDCNTLIGPDKLIEGSEYCIIGN